METVRLEEGNIRELVTRAVEVIRTGGVILYPTDTLYGLGADGLSDKGVATVYEIKGRDEVKPIHAIVADIKTARLFARLSDTALILAKQFWPGALTLIVDKQQSVTSGIGKYLRTIGLRIPNNDFCLALAKEFGGIITTTSANTSGAATPRRVEDILAQLGESAKKIDLVIDAGELPESLPSTVVDLSGARPLIFRDGAIAAEKILEAVSEK